MLKTNNVILDLNNRFGRRGYVWQQDNAPAHRKAMKDGLQYEMRYHLDWPPYSPDLSPIEHM
jgi:transposase